MNTKNKTVAVLMAAIIALAMVPMAVPTMANNNGATTMAVVGGGDPGPGNTPVFEEKFELPDAPGYHGDAKTQVMPVPDANKEVCVYVVVRDPNGADNINRVWIAVDNPDGVQKAYGDTLVSNIDELTYDEAVAATQAAYNQGLISWARKTEIDEHIFDGEWRMWKFCFELTNCDMAGDYTVLAKANDGQGNTGNITNTFEYLSIKELAIDFCVIDYGTVVPGVKQIVSGDEDVTTSDKPTVRNRGNDPFKLKISATDMVGTDSNNKILATNLDAHVYGSATDEEMNLDYSGVTFAPIIDPCTIEKIDFSLKQDVICNDEYTGTITLEPVELGG